MTEQETTLKPCSSWTKFFQLWIVLYILLYIVTSQFGVLNNYAFVERATTWFGSVFLHIDHLSKVQNTGSGDTLYDYVLTLESILFTYFIAIIILVTDRRRNSYRQLYLFTIVIVRYYVAYSMLSYGVAKIFNGQFSVNGYGRLEEKVGDMSPMGMVWAFMGASRSYTFTSGLLECIGGCLLLFRKTQTFGALFSLTVMLNVALLNYNYDIPVKLFSTHLVLFCLFILSFDFKPLFQFFVLHKSAQLKHNRLRFRQKWLLVLLRIIKLLLIIYFFYTCISRIRPTLGHKIKSMEGAYTIHSFVLGSDTITPSLRAKDSLGWKSIIVDYPGVIVIHYNNEGKEWVNAKIDTISKTFTLSSVNASLSGTLHYQMRKDTVTFHGIINTDSVLIISTRKLMKDYSLPNRGFHWISAIPSNN